MATERRCSTINGFNDRKIIKFIGTGEKVDALEEFHPDRIARRILGMGDIVSLVEKASETLEAEKGRALNAPISKRFVQYERFKKPIGTNAENGWAKKLDGNDARNGKAYEKSR